MSKPRFTKKDLERVQGLLTQFQTALTKFAEDVSKVEKEVSAQLAELNKEKI